MKELIEKYREQIKRLENKGHLVLRLGEKEADRVKKYMLEDVIRDLESLQLKGKTSAEEFLRDKYKLVDFHDLTLNGKPWVELMQEYAQSHTNEDGWVRVEDHEKEIQKLARYAYPGFTEEGINNYLKQYKESQQS